MTGKQHAVMWLGILLVITRLFTTEQWHDLWSVFSSKSGASSGSGNSGLTTGGAASSILGNSVKGPGGSTIILPNGVAVPISLYQDVLGQLEGGNLPDLGGVATTPGTTAGNPAAGSGAPY